MKYKTLHHTAKLIDHLIDHYRHSTGTHSISQENIKKLILTNFPDFYMVDYGWHKIVFGIHSIDQEIVLKVGTHRSIESDHRVYKKVPESVRHKFFARIFWHTKYCLLQQYGFPASISPAQLAHLRRVVYKYGIFDVKAENIKRINGGLRIVDASATRIPLPTLIRKLDETKPKLPKQLVNAGRKVSKILDY